MGSKDVSATESQTNKFVKLTKMNNASHPNTAALFSDQVLRGLVARMTAPPRDVPRAKTQLRASIKRKDWNSALKLVRDFPQEAQFAGQFGSVTKGMLPIAWAFELGAPDGLLEELILAYPEGVLWADQCGCLPIHVACLSGANRRHVETLLLLNPKSINWSANFSSACKLQTANPLQLAEAHQWTYHTEEKEAVIEALSKGRHYWEQQQKRYIEASPMAATTSQFYEKLMAGDCPNIHFKLVELVPLLKDVHQMKFYYTTVNTYFRLDPHFDRASYIGHALDKVASMTTSDESIAIFNIILDKAVQDGMISPRKRYELSSRAQKVVIENADFIKELQAAVGENTARINGLEANVKALHNSLEKLRMAMRRKQSIDAGVGFLAVVLNAVSYGLAGSAFTQLMDTKIGEIVDFGDIPEIENILADIPSMENILMEIGGTTTETLLEGGLEHIGSALSEEKLKEAIAQPEKLIAIIAASAVTVGGCPSSSHANKVSTTSSSAKGMEEVREFLANCSLEEFGDAFEEAGYDNLDVLFDCTSNSELLAELAVAVGFKPGHKLKFISNFEAK